MHAIFAPDGTPRALELASPKIDEREVGLVLLERCRRQGGETLLGDKSYAGREFALKVVNGTTNASSQTLDGESV